MGLRQYRLVSIALPFVMQNLLADTRHFGRTREGISDPCRVVLTKTHCNHTQHKTNAKKPGFTGRYESCWLLLIRDVVPRAGIEPAWLAPQDFKSCVSTCFTTEALLQAPPEYQISQSVGSTRCPADRYAGRLLSFPAARVAAFDRGHHPGCVVTLGFVRLWRGPCLTRRLGLQQEKSIDQHRNDRTDQYPRMADQKRRQLTPCCRTP